MNHTRNYSDFLASKRVKVPDLGFDSDVSDFLFDFQRDIVRQALKRGRSAIFADCGLGKTPMQLDWAQRVARETGKPVLILAPLAVAEQTQREGVKFGINVTLAESNDAVGRVCVLDGFHKTIAITNYEKLHHFSPGMYGGLVLDESSILKNQTGHYRTALIQFAKEIPFRLACTATPAPNDLMEIINHAEFLGVMTAKEALAMFFIQDGNTTHKWRLKKHATADFYRWMASWCVACRMPSDLGYDDGDFILPPLDLREHATDGKVTEGYLIPMTAYTLAEQRQARKESLSDRVSLCAALANGINVDSWVIWCNLNQESTELCKAIPDAVEVRGSDKTEVKLERLLGFQSGKYRVMVTKPTIAGHGLNWQHCHNMAFVGLSHSYEQLYQALRRCWRYGQTKEVTAHIIISETEGRILENIRRKEREGKQLFAEIVRYMRDEK